MPSGFNRAPTASILKPVGHEQRSAQSSRAPGEKRQQWATLESDSPVSSSAIVSGVGLPGCQITDSVLEILKPRTAGQFFGCSAKRPSKKGDHRCTGFFQALNEWFFTRQVDRPIKLCPRLAAKHGSPVRYGHFVPKLRAARWSRKQRHRCMGYHNILTNEPVPTPGSKHQCVLPEKIWLLWSVFAAAFFFSANPVLQACRGPAWFSSILLHFAQRHLMSKS